MAVVIGRTNVAVVAGDGTEAGPEPVQRRSLPAVLAVLTALALTGVLGLAATAYVALHTSRGRRLDTAAMDAVGSPQLLLHRFLEALSWVSVASVGLALSACVIMAMARRRLDLALGAVILIGGANATSQILKHDVFSRPDLSEGPNSLPSGHTTVALSIALAVVIVAPALWRSTLAIGATAVATLVGVATVLGRWHRPSDVVAATFVCVLWAAIGLLTAALVGRRQPGQGRPVPAHVGALIGASVAGGLLVSWGVRPQPGLRDLGLGVVSLGSIGLACAISVAAVAYVADRHLG